MITNPLALTIAGSDPSGGAGIQADLKTFQAHYVYGLSVITSVTAQNSVNVVEAYDLSPRIIAAQLETLFEDFRVEAVKTGMLANAEIIETVAEILLRHKAKNLVVDPVMVSTSGFPLLKPDAVKTLKQTLLPKALLVTPNLDEAEILSEMKIDSPETMGEAAKKIGAFTPYVLIKGGHAMFQKGDDLLWDGKEFTLIQGTEQPHLNPHGTGCVYSAAIAANLAQGNTLKQAILSAKNYLQERIEHSMALGQGDELLIL